MVRLIGTWSRLLPLLIRKAALLSTRPVHLCLVEWVLFTSFFFSCSHTYIGQKGRCLNIRLTAHRRSLVGNAYSQGARHCSEHACAPIFRDTTVLSARSNQTAKYIIEAYHIQTKGTRWVSMPSLILHGSECAFFIRFII